MAAVLRRFLPAFIASGRGSAHVLTILRRLSRRFPENRAVGFASTAVGDCFACVRLIRRLAAGNEERRTRKPSRQCSLSMVVRACLKTRWGPAVRRFGGGRGGEVGASPQRAVSAEPTTATAKRTTARRVCAGRTAWLRCSAVEDAQRIFALLAPRHAVLPAQTGPHGVFRQALSGNCLPFSTSPPPSVR